MSDYEFDRREFEPELSASQAEEYERDYWERLRVAYPLLYAGVSDPEPAGIDRRLFGADEADTSCTFADPDVNIPWSA